MRNSTYIWLICLLIGQFYGDLCQAYPSNEKSVQDADYQDDDYDYGSEDDSGNSEGPPPAIVEDVHSAPPYFEHNDIVIDAKPGDDVIINCDARNFEINNVAMWYKNQMILATGQIPINNQLQVMRNNSLKISNVQQEDADEYYCVVLPQNVRQHTTLRVGARLSILCDDLDITDRSQTFKQGDHHKLICQTYLPTKTNIKWSFNGQRLESSPSPSDTTHGIVLLDNVVEENSGIYQCLGDDGSSDPPHGMVTIDVQFAPKVSTHRHHINTQEGGSAELYCDYRANPIAISFFIKDGKTLSISDKYSIRNSVHQRTNRTTLIIKNVDESDLGEYLCHVENSIGSNEVRIQLSYHPETPQFESSSIDGHFVTLHWLVRSLQPLSEAMLDYKLTGTYSWSTVSMIQTHRHDKDSGIWKITHQMELAPGLWHVHVKTKNTEGWSHFSPDHDFIIKDKEDTDAVPADTDDGALPPDELMRASFGGGLGSKSKNNTASTMDLWPALLLGALSVTLRQP